MPSDETVCCKTHAYHASVSVEPDERVGGCYVCGLVTEIARLRGELTDEPPPDDRVAEVLWRAIGNTCDRWDQLPNDIKSDPGCSDLTWAIERLHKAIEDMPEPKVFPLPPADARVAEMVEAAFFEGCHVEVGMNTSETFQFAWERSKAKAALAVEKGVDDENL